MNKFEIFKKEISNEYTHEIPIHLSPSTLFRSRCEFGFSNGRYVMYKDKEKVYMKSFSVAASAIKKVMPILLNEIKNSDIVRKKLFQINFRSNNRNKLLVTFIYHKEITESLILKIDEISKKMNISVLIRSRKFVYPSEIFYLEEKINNIRLFQTDLSFYQPNKFLLEMMIEKIILLINNPKDLLELYCGIGTFTLSLSKKFENIFATENNRQSMKCLEKAIKENHIKNISKARLSAEELKDAFNGKNFNRMKDIDLNNFNFSHVLVDPPRSGLSDDVINLISEFSNIIYVSCNPKTYIEDIKKLKKHNINKIEIFDQFPNTNHMELVSLLTSN